jgi:hypothetical protein
MKRSRPQIHEQVRMGLEHQNRNVVLGERQRRYQSHGTAPNDDDPPILWRHAALRAQGRRAPALS